MPYIKKIKITRFVRGLFYWIRLGYTNKIFKNYKGKILIFEA